MVSQEKLQSILNSYNIPATVIGEKRTARIVTFKVKLKPGQRVLVLNRYKSEIAIELGANNIVIKPLPDDHCYGIEVQLEKAAAVKIGNLLKSSEFKYASSPLSFVVGIDTFGDTIIGDLKEMPHMLVAGTTGSGKSVFLNSIILSLIHRNSPADLEMIMIDPKMVELSIYDDIPHLVVPIITESEKAVRALDYVCRLMDVRYKMFKANAEAQSVRMGHKVRIVNIDDFNKVFPHDKMSHMVVIVDEFADLMMSFSKGKKRGGKNFSSKEDGADTTELENYLKRFGQLARAAGIHLILATQDPRVDVVTGLIKANLPSRIAFKVASGTNSRIVLDRVGAENLLGRGDMLYQPSVDIEGKPNPLRVQGAFVSGEETERAVSHIIGNYGKAVYDDEVLRFIENKEPTYNGWTKADAEIMGLCSLLPNGQECWEDYLKKGYIDPTVWKNKEKPRWVNLVSKNGKVPGTIK